MKIDRHNYEEFFILYWDNELTAVQKQAVENFVNQNADLHEEFELLGETRFTPDINEQFKEKDFLLNSSFINITNYEEQLLNYIDDEVTNEERKEVEKFVTINPVAQKELALLQKTKLQREAEISFPDKSVLYRREEKVRVISLTWFRVAVAAAIILIAGFAAFQLTTGKKEDINPIAKTSGIKDPVSKEKTDPKKTTIEPSTANPDQSIANTNDKSTEEKNTNDKGIKNKVDENSVTSISIKGRENKNNLPEPKNDLIAKNQDQIKDNTLENYTPLKRDSVKAQRGESQKPIYASLTESDVTKKPELALYIPEAEVKEKDGGGIKEFLRKTTRVFERRTKIQTTTDDNKLLVGAFAVSLK